MTDFQKEISVANTSKPKTPSLTDQYLIEAGVDRKRRIHGKRSN